MSANKSCADARSLQFSGELAATGSGGNSLHHASRAQPPRWRLPAKAHRQCGDVQCRSEHAQAGRLALRYRRITVLCRMLLSPPHEQLHRFRRPEAQLLMQMLPDVAYSHRQWPIVPTGFPRKVSPRYPLSRENGRTPQIRKISGQKAATFAPPARTRTACPPGAILAPPEAYGRQNGFLLSFGILHQEPANC